MPRRADRGETQIRYGTPPAGSVGGGYVSLRYKTPLMVDSTSGRRSGAAARFPGPGYELGGDVSVTVTVLVTVLGGDVWVCVIVSVPPVITVVCAPPLLSPATSTPTSTPITRAATIPATASAIRDDVHPSPDGAGGGVGPGGVGPGGGGGW
jgi:hypothetical protein